MNAAGNRKRSLTCCTMNTHTRARRLVASMTMMRRPPLMRSMAGPTSGATIGERRHREQQVQRDLVARRAGRDREEQRAGQRHRDERVRADREGVHPSEARERRDGERIRSARAPPTRGARSRSRSLDNRKGALTRRSIPPWSAGLVPGVGLLGRRCNLHAGRRRRGPGSASVKVEPSPSFDSKRMSPPRLSATWRTMDSPRPVPGTSVRLRSTR